VRILLDNAILVRASSTKRGLARDLLLQIVESQHVLLISNEMLYELAKALRYPRLLALLGLSEQRVYDYIGFLREAAQVVPLSALFTAPVRDANDIIVMQTAIVGEADVLCTRDKDFFEKPAAEYLDKIGIAVLDDITLKHRLRSY
jgi:putative PIN family toxin of toxin-antitoxin system